MDGGLRHFRVVDRDSQRPVAHARVFVATSPGSVVPVESAGVTDEDGACSMEVAHDSTCVCVVARGYLSHCEPLLGAESQVLVVRRGGTLVGRVVDQFGQPVREAEVVAEGTAADGLWPACERWLVAGRTGAISPTGPEGEFLLSGLEPDAEYAVFARAQGYTEAHGRPRVTARSGAAPIVVELLACAVVHLRYRDAETGQPVRGVRSAAFGTAGTRIVGTRVDGSPGTLERDQALWKGEYGILVLAPRPGEWTEGAVLAAELACSRLGYESRRVRIEAPLGATVSTEVTLRRLPSGPWVRARPRAAYSGGRSFDGALWITLKAETGRMDRFLTFEGGVAEEEILVPPGVFRIQPRGARSIGRLWDPAGPEVIWRAAPEGEAPWVELVGHPVFLRVFDPSGVRVRAYDVGGRSMAAPMVMWGRVWSLESLPRGSATEPDPPIHVPGGSFELIIEARGTLRQRIEVKGAGDGSPIAQDVQLTE